jgi:anti-anti-sigma factor
MPFSITLSEKEGIQTVELKGCLTLGTAEVIFRDCIGVVLAQGKRRIVVNLGEVTEIDETGMESLLCAMEKCHESGGRLVLANLHPALIEPLTMAKLKASAEVFGSEQEGINSFFPERYVAPVDLDQLLRRFNQDKGDSPNNHQ